MSERSLRESNYKFPANCYSCIYGRYKWNGPVISVSCSFHKFANGSPSAKCDEHEFDKRASKVPLMPVFGRWGFSS